MKISRFFVLMMFFLGNLAFPHLTIAHSNLIQLAAGSTIRVTPHSVPVDYSKQFKPAGFYTEYHTVYADTVSPPPQPACPQGSLYAAGSMSQVTPSNLTPPPYIFNYECNYTFSTWDVTNNTSFANEYTNKGAIPRTLTNTGGTEFASFNSSARGVGGKSMNVTFVISNNDNYVNASGARLNGFWLGKFVTFKPPAKGFVADKVSTIVTLSDMKGKTSSGKIDIVNYSSSVGYADNQVTASITNKYYAYEKVTLTKQIVANWLNVVADTSALGYSTDEGSSTLICSGTVVVDPAWMGQTIYVDCCPSGIGTTKAFNTSDPSASFTNNNAVMQTSLTPFGPSNRSPCN
jgi:hypothetical protein